MSRRYYTEYNHDFDCYDVIDSEHRDECVDSYKSYMRAEDVCDALNREEEWNK